MKWVLVDTPVWVDHLREPNPQIRALAVDDRILGHPLVVAELAMGSLKNCREMLEHFDEIIMIREVDISEVRLLIENEKLYSSGIGVVDATLLASCLVQRNTFLWTRDRRLNAMAERLGIAYQTLH